MYIIKIHKKYNIIKQNSHQLFLMGRCSMRNNSALNNNNKNIINPYIEIGKRILKRRGDLKITRSTLAKQLSISSKHLEQMECGDCKITMDQLLKIGEITNTNAMYFLTGISNRQIQSAYNLLEKYINVFSVISRLSTIKKNALKDLLTHFPSEIGNSK